MAYIHIHIHTSYHIISIIRLFGFLSLITEIALFSFESWQCLPTYRCTLNCLAWASWSSDLNEVALSCCSSDCKRGRGRGMAWHCRPGWCWTLDKRQVLWLRLRLLRRVLILLLQLEPVGQAVFLCVALLLLELLQLLYLSRRLLSSSSAWRQLSHWHRLPG